MMMLFTKLITEVPEKDGFNFKNFLEGISEFFSGSGLIIEILRFLFIAFVLFTIVTYFIAGRFHKIVHDEMDKGGEEYGEIAATKVLSAAVTYRVLSIVFFAVIIVVLFAGIALFRG